MNVINVKYNDTGEFIFVKDTLKPSTQMHTRQSFEEYKTDLLKQGYQLELAEDKSVLLFKRFCR